MIKKQAQKPNGIDVVALLNKVDFEPEDVVRAAATNSVLYVDAINYRLQCLSKKSEASMNAKRTYAEAELIVRNTAKDNGEKITEGHIKALLATDEVVHDAEKAQEETELLDEYSKLIVKVFEMRRDCLQIVSKWTHEEMRLGGVTDAAREDLRTTRDQAKARFPGGK